MKSFRYLLRNSLVCGYAFALLTLINCLQPLVTVRAGDGPDSDQYPPDELKTDETPATEETTEDTTTVDFSPTADLPPDDITTTVDEWTTTDDGVTTDDSGSGDSGFGW